MLLFYYNREKYDMARIDVKIINKSRNPLPHYATDLSAGMDVRADLEHEISLNPFERFLVPTGLFIELPEGFEAQIRPRSGMALKMGITCLNSPGTIDADYRGEIKVLLVNLSQEKQTIQPGDRIAQMVVSNVATVVWKSVSTIDDTSRGAGGFGHTGNK